VPVVVLEEILRGRLNAIRQAESGKSKIDLARAYQYLEQTLDAFRPVPLLSYSPEADALYQQWRQQKVRGATHDLRIAATCVAHGVVLVSRNRRHFENLPGLDTEFWT
jgi:tRNA(fMet)-specific endonuclease VapC